MANSDKFDLKQSLVQWKISMAAAGNLGPENLKELESHIIDEIDHIDKTDLSQEEKFLVAKHRIGSAKTVGKAFSLHKGISFQQLSWIGQAIAYFLTFRILSMLFATVGYRLILQYIPLNTFTFITVSFLLHMGALVIVFFTYKTVNRSQQRTQNSIRPNIIAFSVLLASALIYFLYINMMGGVQGLIYFPLISSLFLYLIPMALLVVFAVINIREWRKLRYSNSV